MFGIPRKISHEEVCSNRLDEGGNMKQFRLPKRVIKDGAKWVLMPSKIILDSMELWPENQNKVLNAIIFASLVCLFLGEAFYIYKCKADFSKVISGCAVLMCTSEATVRLVSLIYHRKAMSEILKTVYFEFWPLAMAERSFQEKLSKESWYLAVYCFIFTSSAFVSSCQFFIIPIIIGHGELPLLTNYPFQWNRSPLYELLYVWQSLMCGVLPFLICGFDILFASLLWNCIIQFKILGHYLQSRCFNETQNLSAYEHPTSKSEEMRLLVKFVKHHQKVLQTCKKMEDTFTFFALTLILGNTVTVSVPSFLGSILLPIELGKILFYLLGHFCELLLYCFLGSELNKESTALSNAAFESSWNFFCKDTDFRKSWLLVIMRSQKEVHITAAGFSVLDLATFLKALKLAFSLYTLLNSVLDKN